MKATRQVVRECFGGLYSRIHSVIESAFLHDWNYGGSQFTKSEADDIFLSYDEAMEREY